MVLRARGTMDMGVGIVDMATGMLEGLPVSINTFLIVKLKINKIIFNFRNPHFRDSEIKKKYIFWERGTMDMSMVPRSMSIVPRPWCPAWRLLYVLL